MKKLMPVLLAFALLFSNTFLYSNTVYAESNSTTEGSSEVSTYANKTEILTYTTTLKVPNDENYGEKYQFKLGDKVLSKGEQVTVSTEYTVEIKEGWDVWNNYAKELSETKSPNQLVTVEELNGYEIDSITNKAILNENVTIDGNKITVSAPDVEIDYGVYTAYKITGGKLWNPDLTVSLVQTTFSVNATNATVSVGEQTVEKSYGVDKNANNSTTFTFEPKVDEKGSAYVLKSLTVNGEDQTKQVADNQFTISNGENAEIAVVYEPQAKYATYDITVNGDGSVTDEDGQPITGAITVIEGSDATIYVKPNGSYCVESVKVDGKEVALGSEGELVLPYTEDGKVSKVEVTFVAKGIALNATEYVYKHNGQIVVDDNLKAKLYTDLVNPSDSRPVLPENYDSSVRIKYWKKLLVGYWSDLDNGFGKNETETICFEINGVESMPISVTFEDGRQDSSIVLNDNASMVYTKDANTFKQNVFNNINFDVSNLPEDLEVDNFDYFIQVNAYDILCDVLGVSGLEEIIENIPGISDMVLDQLNKTTYVNIAEGTTIGDYLGNIKFLENSLAEILGLDEETLNQTIMPSVGETTVKVSFKGDSNYKTSEVEGTLTITKAPSNITVNSSSIAYGEATPSDLVVANPSDVNKLVVYVGMNANVEGFVSIDLPNGLIYQALETAYPNGFTLNQLTDVLEKLNVAINSEDLDKILAEIPDSVKDFTVQFGKAPKDSGVYLVAGLTMDQNYENDFDLGTYVISPKKANVELTFNSEMLNKYNVFTLENIGTFNFGASCNESEVNVKMVYAGVDYSGNPIVSETPIKEPGVYTETAYTLGGNYYADPISRAYIVRREAIEIEFTNGTKFDYTGNEVDLGTVVTDSHGNVIENVDMIYSYVGANGAEYDGLPTDVGHYIVTAGTFGDADYQFGLNVAAITINKATPEITTENIEKTFDQKPAEAVYTVSDYVDAENVSVEYFDEDGNKLEAAPVNAGNYKYVVSVKGTKNYNSTQVEGTIVIDQADVVVTVADASKVYGQQDPKFTYKTEGLVKGDQLDITLSRAEGENVGTYEITATVEENANYNVVVENGELTITPASVTVTVADASKVYGEDDPKFTYTTEGLVKGDQLDITLSRAEGENVGTYEITATVEENANYNITVNNGTFTIEELVVDSTVSTGDDCLDISKEDIEQVTDEFNDLIQDIIDGKDVTGVSDEVVDIIKQAIEDGKDISIEIVLDTLNINEVAEDERQLVRNSVVNENTTLVSYFELAIKILVDDQCVGYFEELRKPLHFTFDIDSSLVVDGREFKVLRIHQDELDVLATALNGNIVSFDSDKFSTYALYYEKEVKEDDNSTVPNEGQGNSSNDGTNTEEGKATDTGDTTNVVLPMMGVVLAGLVLAVLAKKRRSM